jgi:hypothetical protein
MDERSFARIAGALPEGSRYRGLLRRVLVIAHELGHVTSGHPCGVVTAEGQRITRLWSTVHSYRELGDLEAEVNERTADAIARDWGFWQEEAAFKAALLDCG